MTLDASDLKAIRQLITEELEQQSLEYDGKLYRLSETLNKRFDQLERFVVNQIQDLAQGTNDNYVGKEIHAKLEERVGALETNSAN